MSDFDRSLGPSGLDQLQGLAERPGDNWWKDLLLLWRPAGREAGATGLRLAVRNGYLNFYLRGQSVARIGFTRGSVPFAKTHIKYAALDEHESRQGYVSLIGDALWDSGSRAGNYDSTIISRWISRADKWGQRKGGIPVAPATLVTRRLATPYLGGTFPRWIALASSQRTSARLRNHRMSPRVSCSDWALNAFVVPVDEKVPMDCAATLKALNSDRRPSPWS
jgi:hypothetical protein